MPLEFALRPRIRLRDDFAAPPRRSRLRVPRFALPVLGYWLAMGGITYALTHWHGSEPAEAAAELATNEPFAAGDSAPEAPLPAAPAAPVEPPPEPERAPAADVSAAAPLASPEPGQEPEAALKPEPEPEAADTGRGSRSEPWAPVAAAARARARRGPREDLLFQTRSAPTVNKQPTDDLSLALALPDATQPEQPSASQPPPPEHPRLGGSLPSCEAAAAAATQDLDFASSDRTADLPSSAIAGVLENGAWLSSCGVPASTSLEVCVAIKGGRVTAATVVSRPADASLNACVKQRAAALQFPYSTRVDIARTRF